MTRVLLAVITGLVLLVAALDEPPAVRSPHPWIVVTTGGEF